MRTLRLRCSLSPSTRERFMVNYNSSSSITPCSPPSMHGTDNSGNTPSQGVTRLIMTSSARLPRCQGTMEDGPPKPVDLARLGPDMLDARRRTSCGDLREHHHKRHHNPSYPSSFAEIRVQGSVSPNQETDSAYRATRSTPGTVSSLSIT